MHTERRVLWEVSLADDRIKWMCMLMPHYSEISWKWIKKKNNTKPNRTIFLSHYKLSVLFSFLYFQKMIVAQLFQGKKHSFVATYTGELFAQWMNLKRKRSGLSFSLVRGHSEMD